jgi:hypothetical protein
LLKVLSQLNLNQVHARSQLGSLQICLGATLGTRGKRCH